MKKRMMLFLIFVIVFALLFVNFINAGQLSSSNYGADVILSSGGGNSSSTNYQSEVSSGIISGNSSSSSYSQSTGFFILPEEAEAASEGTTPPVTLSPGGGGGGATALEAFTVNTTLIKTLIKQGETQRELVEIKNNLDSTLDIEINSSLKRFMAISEESFSLAPRESKTIFIDIFAKEDEPPEAYTGKITITGNGKSKIINLILEIKERKPLFDVSVDVISKKVPIDGNVKARLKVSNLGDLNNIDVYFYYAIKDFDGNVLSFKEENIAIDKELTVTRTLAVPSAAYLGDYVFYFKASYGNISASSTESFEVVEKEAISFSMILLISSIALSLIVLVSLIILIKKFRYHKAGKIIHKTIIRKIYTKPKQEKIGLIVRMKINAEKHRIEKEKRKMLEEALNQKRIAERRNYFLKEKIRKEEARKLYLKQKLQKEIERKKIIEDEKEKAEGEKKKIEEEIERKKRQEEKVGKEKQEEREKREKKERLEQEKLEDAEKKRKIKEIEEKKNKEKIENEKKDEIEKKLEKRRMKEQKKKERKLARQKRLAERHRPKPERIGFFKRRKIAKEKRKKEKESRRLLRELAWKKKMAEKENKKLKKIKQKEHRRHLRLQRRKQRRLERDYRRKMKEEKRFERRAHLIPPKPAKESEKPEKEKEKPVSLQEDLMKEREI